MQAEVKREILLMVHRAKEKGVKLTRSCEILQLPLQRYCAWSRRDREEKLDGVSDPLLDGKPGPAPDEAPHGLLREEKEQISALLRDETYADLPPHQLAVVASEKGVVQASASSFYRQARKERLARRKQVRTPVKQSKPQVKPEGPNQVWSWDLTYIPFFGLFLYFTAILDVYSRKIVGWKLSFNATVEQVKQAWDQALANEGLLDLDTGPISLTALSDHGSQMKAKSMAQFFKEPGHLAAVCPISNTHGQRLDRSLFPDIQIRLAALPGHLHIPSTGRPDCFLHSQLQRRTLSRGNTVCHASSEA